MIRYDLTIQQNLEEAIRGINREQNKREFNKNDITKAELELLEVLLDKVYSCYGSDVREQMTENEVNSIRSSSSSIHD